MKVFMHYVKDLYTFSKKKFISIVGLMIIEGLSSGIGLLMLIPLLTITGISGQRTLNIPGTDNIINQLTDYPLQVQLLLVLCVYLLLIVFQSIVRKTLSVLNVDIIQGFIKYLRVSLYKKILKSEWSCFVRKKKSDITNFFTTEIMRIGTGTVCFLRIISQLVVSVFQFAVAFMMSVPLTFFVFICGAIVLWVMKSTLAESKKLGESLRCINQNLVSQIMEQLNGIREAKSYGIESVQLHSFNKTAEGVRRNLVDFIKLQSKTTLLYNISAAVVICILFYVSIIFLKIKPAALLIIIYIFARLWPSFKTLQNNLQNVIVMIPSYAALQSLYNDFEFHEEKLSEVNNIVKIRFDDPILFENVCFYYDGSKGFELKNLNFVIPAKKTTAIIGKSGAGKSTIINLLIGLLKPVKGQIKIGDTIINEQLLYPWRKNIAYVPQDPFLFNSTIKKNILQYTPDASEEEIKDALRKASALDFVTSLSKGLDTVVGDNGVRLSGGERQRIVLARALLRKPQYLVLDEATSSLDTENEYKIQNTVETLSGSLTIIIIAHRLSTIRNADNIIVIDKGQFSEQGTYDELSGQNESYLAKSLELLK